MGNDTDKQKFEAYRQAQMRQLGQWILGPVVTSLVLFNIYFDRILYPELWQVHWSFLRLSVVPVSLLAVFLVRSPRFGGLWADYAGWMIAVYVAAIHAYLITETGYAESKYVHSTIQLLIGAAILPIRQVTFFLLVPTLVALYAGTLASGGGNPFDYLLRGDGTILHTYIFMSALLYYVFRFGRHAGYRAQIALEKELAGRASEIQRLVAEKVEAQKNDALVGLARQVAHDIRSPLSALQMLSGHLNALPEEHRVLLRNATSRIKQIANNLLERNRTETPSQTVETSSSHLATALLDSIVAEKQVQYSARRGLEVKLVLDESSYGAFVDIEPTEFKRIFSNLIDNGVEALLDAGRIEVRCVKRADRLRIEVLDSGRGIPPEILPKLMQSGASYGKAKGSGLGLFHAKRLIQAWKGTISLASNLGQGTQVTVELPLQSPPEWFVPSITLKRNATIVILDDDPTIHRLWSQRLKAHVDSLGLGVLHFAEASEMKAWLKTQSTSNVLFLVDFELIAQQTDGLSLIEELKIQNQSLLVTSGYEEAVVRDRCKQLGVALLPKALAASVPFRIVDLKSVPQKADGQPFERLPVLLGP